MANTLWISRQIAAYLRNGWVRELKKRDREQEKERVSRRRRESKKIPAEFSNIIFIDYLMQKLFHRRVLLQFAKIEAEIFANYIKQKSLIPTSPSSYLSHPIVGSAFVCIHFLGGLTVCSITRCLFRARPITSYLSCSALHVGYYTTDWYFVLLKASSKSLISTSADISSPRIVASLCLAGLYRFKLSVTWNRMYCCGLTFSYFSAWLIIDIQPYTLY